ncbi:SCP2 sterol-binding domain-containing protein [Agromyces bauzanensis]
MTSTAEFFEQLGRRGHEPLLKRVSASVRFDIADGAATEHRLVRIDHGDVTVTTDDAPADCVLVADRAEFDDIVGGRTSALASLLRGTLTIEGDLELLVLAQRLFADRPDNPSAPDTASEKGGRDD